MKNGKNKYVNGKDILNNLRERFKMIIIFGINFNNLSMIQLFMKVKILQIQIAQLKMMFKLILKP